MKELQIILRRLLKMPISDGVKTIFLNKSAKKDNEQLRNFRYIIAGKINIQKGEGHGKRDYLIC